MELKWQKKPRVFLLPTSHSIVEERRADRLREEEDKILCHLWYNADDSNTLLTINFCKSLVTVRLITSVGTVESPLFDPRAVAKVAEFVEKLKAVAVLKLKSMGVHDDHSMLVKATVYSTNLTEDAVRTVIRQVVSSH